MSNVNHPRHYNVHASGVECIDVIEWLPYNVGAALKHVWRVGLKGSAREDLEKALWYMKREEARLALDSAALGIPPSDVHVTAALPEYTRALDAVLAAGGGDLATEFCSELRQCLARGWIVMPAAVSRLVLSVELRLAVEPDDSVRAAVFTVHLRGGPTVPCPNHGSTAWCAVCGGPNGDRTVNLALCNARSERQVDDPMAATCITCKAIRDGV